MNKQCTVQWLFILFRNQENDPIASLSAQQTTTIHKPQGLVFIQYTPTGRQALLYIHIPQYYYDYQLHHHHHHHHHPT